MKPSISPAKLLTKLWVNCSKSTNLCLIFAATLGMSSCSSLVKQFPFDIEKVSTSSGEIWEADIQTDNTSVYLYGRLLFESDPGHLDASIITPDGSINCMSQNFTTGSHAPSYPAGYKQPSRHSHKRFQLHLDFLPEAGSLVRVWHHQGAIHQGCEIS